MSDAYDVGGVGGVDDFFGVELADVVEVVVSFFEPPGALLESVNKRNHLTSNHLLQMVEMTPMLRLNTLTSTRSLWYDGLPGAGVLV